MREQKHLDAQLLKPTQQISCPLQVDQVEFPLLVHVDPTGKALQIMMVIPCTMRPKAPIEMARLLHLFNREIDMPGFGMDERSGLVFYRYLFPTHNGQLAAEVFDNVLNSLPLIARAFAPFILDVANGAYFEAIHSDVTALFQKMTQGE